MVSEACSSEAADARTPTSAHTRVALGRLESSTVELGAALRRAPSLSFRRTGSPGSPVTASIRGSAADQVIVELAGLPLTPPGGGPVDLSSLPPSLLGGVGVTRGTEAAVHGAGALGGVLRLEPIRPLGSGGGSTGADRPGDSQGRLLLRGDTLRSAGGSAAWGRDLGGARLSGALDFHASQGSFSFERQLTPNLPDADWLPTERSHNGVRMGSGLLSAEMPAGPGELRLTAFGHRAGHEVAGMVGFPTPGAKSETRRSMLGGSFTAGPSGRFALLWTATLWTGSDGYAFEPGEHPAPGAGTPFDTSRRILGARGSAEALFSSSILKLGADASLETLAGSAVDATRASASLFVSDTVFLFSDRLTTHGALRLDAFEGLEPTLSPRLGGRLDLHFMSLLANVGYGHRMPALFELHGQTALVDGNAELRPESALTVDGGVEMVSEEMSFRVVAWHSRYRDLIAYELFPPMRLRPLNVGSARIRGIEVEARFEPAGPIELSASYTLTDTRNLSTAPNVEGRALPHRPRHRGYILAALTGGPFRLHVDLEAQSSYPRNRSSSKWTKSRLLLGSGVMADLGSDFFAGATFTNLLDDQRLEDLFGYPLPGRAGYLIFGLDL